MKAKHHKLEMMRKAECLGVLTQEEGEVGEHELPVPLPTWGMCAGRKSPA